MGPLRVVISCVLVLATGAMADAGDKAEPPQDRVLILLAKQFNRGEFQGPYLALKAAGYKVDVAAPEKGTVSVSGRDPSPHDAQANLSLDDVRAADYVGLVIPGGFSPGNLEKFPRSIEICREFVEAEKPVSAICHGMRLLMRGGLMKGRIGTCLYKVADELADAWAAREYGKYLDQAVVVDRKLVTSRYPGDLSGFTRATLDQFEAAGGLPVPRREARVVVIGPGIGGHEKWVLTETPKVLNVGVTFLREGDIAKFIQSDGYDPKGFDLLAVVDGPALEKLKGVPEFRKLVGDFQVASITVLAADKACALLGEMGLADDMTTVVAGDLEAMLSKIVAHAQDAARARPDAEPEVPTYTAAVVLAEGFDERIVAAVEAFLKFKGQKVLMVGSKPGWVRGDSGVPFWIDTSALGFKGLRVELGGGVTVLLGVAHELAEDLERLGKAVVAGPDEAGEYDAAVALREGFDDKAFAAMLAYLRLKGRKVVVVGPKKGELRGLNGVAAQVQAAYGDRVSLAGDAVIVAPGGVWPEKAAARQAVQPEWIDEQARADRKRLDWLLGRYEKGATLVTFGFDSLRVGRNEAFKGKRFASSDQTVWSFGRSGGGYAGERAVLSAERLISAKGASCVADALKLLEAAGR